MDTCFTVGYGQCGDVPMNFISLFSGIGGFDLGFQRAGLVPDAVCEIDRNAQNILVRHFPKAKLFDDVRKVGNQTHERKSIDLICGGFPCQDLSIAGKRAGLAGERSGLWFEFARIIDELEPRYAIIENVPGLLSSNKGRDFAVILRWLVERGYGVCWRVLDAQYFGVAQRRRRVFIVASLGNGRAAEILFEPEGMSRDTPPSRETGKEVAFTLRRNPSHSGDKGDGGINTTLIPTAEPYAFSAGNSGESYGIGLGVGVTPPLRSGESGTNQVPTIAQAETFTIRSGKEGGGKGYLGAEEKAMTLGGQQQHLAFTRQRSDEYKEGDIVETISQRDYKSASDLIAYNIQNNDGGSHKRKDRPNGGMYVNETDTSLTVGTTDRTVVAWEMSHASEAYREAKGGIAPTLQSRMGTGGNQVPLVGVRRLTPTECERLQGFPDGWTDGQSDSVRYRQLGNAVTVNVIEWLGKRIMAL